MSVIGLCPWPDASKSEANSEVVEKGWLELSRWSLYAVQSVSQSVCLSVCLSLSLFLS